MKREKRIVRVREFMGMREEDGKDGSRGFYGCCRDIDIPCIPNTVNILLIFRFSLLSSLDEIEPFNLTLIHNNKSLFKHIEYAKIVNDFFPTKFKKKSPIV